MDISRSTAYLKRIYPNGDGDEPSIQLSEEDSPVEHLINDELAVLYLVDEGSSFSYVQKRHLIKENMAITDLHTIGINNLNLLARTIKQTRTDSGLIYFHGNGNFESSMILVDYVWDELLAEYCPNGFVAGFPARDLLATCDIKDKANIDWIRNFSNKTKEYDHPITSNLYTRIKESPRWTLYR